jgi:capsular polysaccharide biosynthesis protein
MHNTRQWTLREVLTILFRHKILIFTVFLISVITVYVKQELKTPAYLAQVKMLVSGTMQSDLDYRRSLGSGSIINTHMELVKSMPVIERSVKALKLYNRPFDYEKKFATHLKGALITYRQKQLKRRFEELDAEQKYNLLYDRAVSSLYGNISVGRAGGENSPIFFIGVKDFDGAQAVKIANVVSRSYIIFDLEHQIAELQLVYGEKNITIQKLEHHIEKLKQSLDGRVLADIEALGPASVKIINQARSTRFLPVEPGKGKMMIAALVMSIALGAVIAFASEMIRPTFRTPYDIEKELKIPFLGSIPKRKSRESALIKNPEKLTRYSYSLQSLSEDVYILMKDKNIKSLLLSDSRVSEETTEIIVNIGTFLTQKIKQMVLIIDANIKAPTLSKVLNVPDSPGLVEVLEGKIALEDAIRQIGPDMYYITSGGSLHHTTALLECSKMSKIIQELKDRYGTLLVNYACLKQYCDAVILSTIADGVLFVLNEGKSRREDVKYAVSFIKQKEISVLGAVLNNRTFVVPKVIYKMT